MMSGRLVKTLLSAFRPIKTIQTGFINTRSKVTLVSQGSKNAEKHAITSAIPAQHLSAKVIFNNCQTADFKYIWLRDNCRCNRCVDANTQQKIVDTPSIDVNIRPKGLIINESGELEVTWTEQGENHVSTFDPQWLYKYGQSFIHNSFESDTIDMEHQKTRSELKLWNRSEIWANFPEVNYKEFMESEEGLRLWLDMFYKYGVAMLRGVPPNEGKLVDIVKRFAYVKETQYGIYFDVINKPQKGAHLAYSGRSLTHHTDMNYRENSPGMQILHCLKANDPKQTGSDPGGRSFFVDGYRAAKWMEDNEPAAFHVLTSTPVRFSIRNEGMRYSATWPVICLNVDGDVTEIHYNNRTLQPLQAPAHVVTPFYHAYKLFTQKLREPSNGLEIQMLPGDLVAFNNRRTLHGRTAFDPLTVNRHLQGCYVDIDEAWSKYDLLQAKYMEVNSLYQYV